MTNPRSRIVAAVAGVFSLSAAAWAVDVAPAATSQEAKIRELEAKVAALETKQDLGGKQMDATIDSVLKDADRRSKLLATSGNAEAGYDNGFYIRQGDFELHPRAWMQFRNVINYRKNTAGPKDDEFEQGFEIRRTRLELEGSAFNHINYLFSWESNREGGNMSLLDAWVSYMWNNDWGIKSGQFKEPLTHEKLVSSRRQLAADRSMLDNLMGGELFNRVQGVTIIYGGADPNKGNPWNAQFGITDGGPQSMNTNFTKHNFDFGLVGRVEYKVMGDWRDYMDFSAKDTRKDLLVVGGGLDWSQAGDANMVTAAVDAQWENTAGLGVYGGIIISHRDDNFTGGDDTTDWGFLVQAGYMLNKSWEVFGRLDVGKFDNDILLSGGSTEDTFYEITGGVNYFLGPDGAYGHRAKFTIDASILPNGSPAVLTGLGYLDANDGDTEIVIRTQFQLVI